MKLPDWGGRTCAIIAGGPSANVADADRVRAADLPTIVINNSYQLAPWADILYFCDDRWWGWHENEPALKAFCARDDAAIVTLDNLKLVEANPYIISFKNTGRLGLERESGGLRNGSNSGYQAINLAIHLGAKRILLLGYDMGVVGGKDHWHAGHPVSTPASLYTQLLIPAYATLAPELKREGIVVQNCCMTSALTVFPLVPLNEALQND